MKPRRDCTEWTARLVESDHIVSRDAEDTQRGLFTAQTWMFS